METITSNYRTAGANAVWMWIIEWATVNRLQLIRDDDWAFTSMDAEIGSSKFYSWGLNFIYYRYNLRTCFPIIASNKKRLVKEIYRKQLPTTCLLSEETMYICYNKLMLLLLHHDQLKFGLIHAERSNLLYFPWWIVVSMKTTISVSGQK